MSSAGGHRHRTAGPPTAAGSARCSQIYRSINEAHAKPLHRVGCGCANFYSHASYRNLGVNNHTGTILRVP